MSTAHYNFTEWASENNIALVDDVNGNLSEIDSCIYTQTQNINRSIADINDAISDLQDEIDNLDGNIKAKLDVITSDSKVLCIGDSFLNGSTTEGVQRTWAEYIQSMTGATVHEVHHGGSGYSRADSGVRFIDLLQQAISEHPNVNYDWILVQGGYNDRAQGFAQVESDVEYFANAVKTAYPNAKVQAFACCMGNQNVNDDILKTALAIQKGYAKANNGKMVVHPNCWNWLYDYENGSGYVSSDRLHPLSNGSAIIASYMLMCCAGTDINIDYAQIATTNDNCGYSWAYRKGTVFYVFFGNASCQEGETICSFPDNYNVYSSYAFLTDAGASGVAKCVHVEHQAVQQWYGNVSSGYGQIFGQLYRS